MKTFFQNYWGLGHVCTKHIQRNALRCNVYCDSFVVAWCHGHMHKNVRLLSMCLQFLVRNHFIRRNPKRMVLNQIMRFQAVLSAFIYSREHVVT
jgi:hypothetical protein